MKGFLILKWSGLVNVWLLPTWLMKRTSGYLFFESGFRNYMKRSSGGSRAAALRLVLSPFPYPPPSTHTILPHIFMLPTNPSQLPTNQEWRCPFEIITEQLLLSSGLNTANSSNLNICVKHPGRGLKCIKLWQTRTKINENVAFFLTNFYTIFIYFFAYF